MCRQCNIYKEELAEIGAAVAELAEALLDLMDRATPALLEDLLDAELGRILA